MGFDVVGDLTKKQDFHRLSRQVIIESFQKFKGNLNREEVKIAIDAFAGLGISEQSNRNAIATGLAAAQVARERASQASELAATGDAKAIAAFEKELLSGEDTTRFLELVEQFKREMSGEPEPVPPGIPPDAKRVIGRDGSVAWKDSNGQIWVP